MQAEAILRRAARCLLRCATAACAAIMLAGPARAQGKGAGDSSCLPHPVETAAPAARDAPIQVRFAGVSTLVFSDGETSWMTDGFFTRPGPLRTFFGLIKPDERIIDCNLERLGVTKLAAVVPVHSHYDHAMDAPFVAWKTGAELIGSDSTLNVGRGLRPDQPRLRKVQANEAVRLGGWTLSFHESHHGPAMFTMAAEGSIDALLVPSRNARRWKQGAVWSILVEHDRGPRMLVHASAGPPGEALKKALAERGKSVQTKVDVVFLGVGLLAKAEQKDRRALWDEVVVASGAKRVIPIHWDNFTRSLDNPLACAPRPFDNVGKTLAELREWAGQGQVEIVMPPVFAPFDPAAVGNDGKRWHAPCS